MRTAADRKAEAERYKQMTEESQQRRVQPTPPGYYSNLKIQQRNGGVRHQFQDDIGGCSANYR